MGVGDIFRMLKNVKASIADLKMGEDRDGVLFADELAKL